MVRATAAWFLAELAGVARLVVGRVVRRGITSPTYGTKGAVCARLLDAHAHPP